MKRKIIREPMGSCFAVVLLLTIAGMGCQPTVTEESGQSLALAMLLLADESTSSGDSTSCSGTTDTVDLEGAWTLTSMTCAGVNYPLNTYTNALTVGSNNAFSITENNARTLCGVTDTFANCTSTYTGTRCDNSIDFSIDSISPDQASCPGINVGTNISATIQLAGNTLTQTRTVSGVSVVLTYTK